MQLVAKNLLTDFAATFKGRSKGQLARWALAHKLKTLRARLPSGQRPCRQPARGGNADRAFPAARGADAALCRRPRVRALTAGGRHSPYAAFTAEQNDLLALAHAHVERVVLERFNAGIAACPDAGLRPILTKLRDLFALSHLEKGRAWFLENGLLSPARSRALTREVDPLCAEVRREAVALVDAFGIPPECLAAPIALD